MQYVMACIRTFTNENSNDMYREKNTKGKKLYHFEHAFVAQNLFVVLSCQHDDDDDAVFPQIRHLG